MSKIASLLRLFRYGFASQRTDSPLMVLFPVTTRCDMKCRHCGDDVWGDPALDLTLEEIERATVSLGACADLAIGGGEPFLRRDLPEICRLFVANSGVRNLGIATNGFAPDRILAAVERILELCPETNVGLSLSLDGTEPTHDDIRCPGSYRRVMETARRLAALRDKRPNLDFFFNSTINEANWRELPELAQLVKRDFGTFLDYNVLTGNPRDPDLRLPAQADLAAAMDGIYAARADSAVSASLFKVYREAVLRTNEERRQVVPCRAGSLIAIMEANGNVRACTLLPVLGNLRDRSFREIWQSDAAKRQHRSIIRGECACNDSCYVISSLNHTWKLPFYLLGQRVKELLAGG